MSIQILWSFFTGLFVLLLLRYKTFLCIQDTSSLSAIWLSDIFSCSVGCLFTFLMVSCEAQKFLILMSFSIFFLLEKCQISLPKEMSLSNVKCHCQVQDHEDLLHVSNYFIVSALNLGLWYTFWINFCIWCEIGIWLHSCSTAICWKIH